MGSTHLSQREGNGDDVGGGATQLHKGGVDHALRGGDGLCKCVTGGGGAELLDGSWRWLG